MIEQTMQDLKDEMAELRTAIAAMVTAMAAHPVDAPKTSISKTAEAVPEKQDSSPTVSRDDLQELCMTIVRNDRSKKAAVRDAISSFGGSVTLKDVPDADLSALRVKLEAVR